MRKAPVSNEARLWSMLRDRRVGDVKFRRQVAIGPYVVDFLCLRHRLIVEADGEFFHALHAERDALRDAWLRAQGFRVLRVPNALIANEPETVRRLIRAAVEPMSQLGATPHPTPFGGHLLPQGEKDAVRT